jgi:hypothetical protein
MAVTANQLITRSDGCKGSGPVAASTTLYGGTLCFINEAGNIDDDTATGQNRLAGVNIEYIDNSSGAAGALSAEFWQEGEFTLTGSGFALTDVGSDVYATDNYTVTVAPSASAVYVGRCTAYVSSTKIKVEINPDGRAGTSKVATKTADYTVLASDSGKTFATTGAAGAVVFAMPAAVPGLKYRFYVGAAQQLRIDPNGTETISLPSTGVASAAGAYIVADAAGETVDVECVVAGSWSVFGYTGTWTAV